MGVIDTVHSVTEIAYDVPLASQELTTALAALAVSTLSLVRRTVSSSFPVRFLSSTPLCNGGQRRY
jgi:hypothetical protein